MYCLGIYYKLYKMEEFCEICKGINCICNVNFNSYYKIFTNTIKISKEQHELIIRHDNEYKQNKKYETNFEEVDQITKELVHKTNNSLDFESKLLK